GRRADAGARGGRHPDRRAGPDNPPDPGRFRRHALRPHAAIRRVAGHRPGTFYGVSRRVLLYDTTLRDGMQGEGRSLSVDEKLRVAHALDGLGMHFIEAGFPSSNPKEEALFGLLAGETFEHAEVAAFGMTRRRGVTADADPALRLLADSF